MNSIIKTVRTPFPNPDKILMFNPWLKALALKYDERIIIDNPAAIQETKKCTGRKDEYHKG